MVECVCGGQRDGQTRVRAGSSPFSPAHLSHNTAPPPRAAATHGARSTDGRWAGAWRRWLVAGVQLRTKTMLLQYYEQFHSVTK